MGTSVISGLALAGVLALSTGCASMAPSRGTADIDKMIAERGAPAPAWPQAGVESAGDERVAALLREPLSVEGAVQLAFLRNAGIRATYAELGIAQADVLQASRLTNPTIGYVDLSPRGGGRSQISRSISLGFMDLLLMPARGRIARTAFESTRERVGAQLLNLQAKVEAAWFEYVNALQVAEMRAAVAEAAGAAGEYAQQLHAAGNISRREFSMKLAASSEAQIGAARAQGQALRSRAQLAALIGVSTREGWKVPQRLPAPLSAEAPPEEIVDQALASRLDVSATRREIVALEGGLRLTRRWRWLGDVEVGYERETETDGAKLEGPSVAVQLPIFNRNGHGVLRAQAQLEAARAHLSELELAVRNDVALGLDRLAASREISESYRTALVPLRETVVERTQEEVNFMLVGAFELLEARREQFDAYQEYLEAVRDYWVARVELRQAVGGRLPGDEQRVEETVGVEAILAPKPAMDHSRMDHSRMDHSQMHHDAPTTGAPAQPQDTGDPR